MKVYISGKITGLDRQVAVANFARAEKILKSKGYEVVNPTRLCAADMDWEEAMKICIAELVKCDAIYLLSDWTDSKGAKIEVQEAYENCIQFLNH